MARWPRAASGVDDIADHRAAASTAPRPIRAGPTPASSAPPAPSPSRSSTPTSPSSASTAATTTSLRTGPYNFGFLNNPALGNWVEHFPYQDGLLVWYYDTSFADNNVGDNCALRALRRAVPAGGRAPRRCCSGPTTARCGARASSRYDSTFGLETTDAICLHANSVEQLLRRPARRTRCSTTRRATGLRRIRRSATSAGRACRCPSTGTTIRVVGTSSQGDFLQLVVAPKR